MRNLDNIDMLARHEALRLAVFSGKNRNRITRPVQGTRLSSVQSPSIINLQKTAASARRRDALLVRFRPELSPDANAEGINIPVEAQQVGG